MSLFNKNQSENGREGGGKGGYGIAEATLLMRTLPVDQNVELVVRVIRSTLESMNVQLSSIIEDAEDKEKSLKERMATLNGEIAAFAREIEQRRAEIASLETDLDETSTVKSRLVLAQKLSTSPARAAGDVAPSPSTPPPIPPKLNGKNGVEVRDQAR